MKVFSGSWSARLPINDVLGKDPLDSHALMQKEIFIRRENDRFKGYAHQQAVYEQVDRKTMTSITGKVALPSVRQIIGPDPCEIGSMSHAEGKAWPSVRYDFGHHAGRHAGDELASGGEFRMHFNPRDPKNFQELLNLAPKFSVLGLQETDFRSLLKQERFCEEYLYDKKINPDPKSFGIKNKKLDMHSIRLEYLAEIRQSFSYAFNDYGNSERSYLRVHFEFRPSPRLTTDQDIVFTFPTSNEERIIWNHVFLGTELPNKELPVETETSKFIKEFENQQVAKINLGIQALDIKPPAYRFT